MQLMHLIYCDLAGRGFHRSLSWWSGSYLKLRCESMANGDRCWFFAAELLWKGSTTMKVSDDALFSRFHLRKQAIYDWRHSLPLLHWILWTWTRCFITSVFTQNDSKGSHGRTMAIGSARSSSRNASCNRRKRMFTGSACCEVGETQHGFACLDLFLSVHKWCGGSPAWRSLEFDEAGSLNKRTHTPRHIQSKKKRWREAKKERSGSTILTYSSYLVVQWNKSSMIRGARKMEGSLHLSWTARSSLVGVSAPFRFSYAAAIRERSSAHGNRAYKIASLRFRLSEVIRVEAVLSNNAVPILHLTSKAGKTEPHQQHPPCKLHTKK